MTNEELLEKAKELRLDLQKKIIDREIQSAWSLMKAVVSHLEKAVKK